MNIGLGEESEEVIKSASDVLTFSSCVLCEVPALLKSVAIAFQVPGAAELILDAFKIKRHHLKENLASMKYPFSVKIFNHSKTWKV